MKNKIFRFEPKQTETRSVSRLFRFVSWNPNKNFRFVSVFRTFIETTKTNRTVSKRTETIRNFFLQRLRIKQKEAIRVINNAGYRDHTQPLFNKKKTKSSSWTQWLNTLIFGLCTVISTTIFPSLLNNYGYPTETIKYNPSQRVFLKFMKSAMLDMINV